MKKIILLTIVVIMIPCIINATFFYEKEKKFNYKANMFVRVKRDSTGNIDIVPLEEYVVGVVAGEMPISFDLEALKAQSLAARSYVYKKMEQNINNEYDVVDTVMNQVYLDNNQLKKNWKDKYITNINKIRTAVFETQGEYITYNGEVINAFFFSTSTGKTENSEEVFTSYLPYLRSVDSIWDSNVSPVYSVNKQLKLSEFYTNLGLTISETLNIKIIDSTSTGRIKKISINNKEFTGSEIVNALSLTSTFFTIESDNNYVYINTKGYGHGVGMSQYGAYGMAQAGYKYDEIIKYYYKGVDISKM